MLVGEVQKRTRIILCKSNFSEVVEEQSRGRSTRTMGFRKNFCKRGGGRGARPNKGPNYKEKKNPYTIKNIPIRKQKAFLHIKKKAIIRRKNGPHLMKKLFLIFQWGAYYCHPPPAGAHD